MEILRLNFLSVLQIEHVSGFAKIRTPQDLWRNLFLLMFSQSLNISRNKLYIQDLQITYSKNDI